MRKLAAVSTGCVMNKKKLPSPVHFSNILQQIFPSWGPSCPDGNSFGPLLSSGQEKGCFGVGFGVFCVRTYP